MRPQNKLNKKTSVLKSTTFKGNLLGEVGVPGELRNKEPNRNQDSKWNQEQNGNQDQGKNKVTDSKKYRDKESLQTIKYAILQN